MNREQLLIDIENTEKEIEAYNQLSKGFATLAELPEAHALDAKLHNAKSRNYLYLSTQCSVFLNKLLKFKEDK